MFDKIKDAANKNYSSLEDKASNLKVEMSEKNDELSASISEKITTTKKSFNDLSVLAKIKEFTSSSVHTVEEIDKELLEANSQYEINNFRVSATAGVTAGMTLDIHFVKTQTAKEVAKEMSKFLVVKNPKTGSTIKIPRTALANKEFAKVKDPSTNEVLTINTKTGQIVSPEE